MNAGSAGLFDKILPLEDFQGLSPKAWICVGAGFSREDVKAWLLSHQRSFVGETVQTFPALCQRILSFKTLSFKTLSFKTPPFKTPIEAESVLSSPGRQEVLRLLLSVPGVREKCPELKRLKRQGTFLRRLDHAIQAGRMSFAHWEEAEVYSDRLAAKQGENPVRQEVERLARAYESWLESSELWDPPLVIRQAIEVLNAGDEFALPETIYYLCAQTQESLEKNFWEVLGRKTRVVLVGPEHFKASRQAEFQWERWHTLDDSAERLADLLFERFKTGTGLSNTAVLISDVPSARRSLKRALQQRGIPLSDPRDPTRIRWDESIKWAMLPLDVVARGFERTRVIPLIHRYAPEYEGLIQEIGDRGIRSGLPAYSGGKLSSLHHWLAQLNSRLGGKKTVIELAQAHLKFLAEVLDSPDKYQETAWVYGFFEQIWKQLIQDLGRVDLTDRRAAPLYWLERLQTRVSEAPSPVERLKPLGGLDVYRLHQAPSKIYEKIICFGMPALWFSGEGLGDYWFSEREREVLSTEFSVRSGIQIRQERAHALKAWFGGASEVIFLDALYDPAGRERESIQAAIEEIARWDTGLHTGSPAGLEGAGLYACPEEPVEMGSHPRWLKSYGALRPVPAQKTKLPAKTPLAPGEKPLISASALENYSRCGFLALARNRWKLEDLSEPDTDLWPQMKGILLHEAVRLLVESRDDSGNFSKTAEEVVDSVWAIKRPKGLLQGARIEAYVKRKLVILLRTFEAQEKKYVQRAQTKVVALENVDFKVDYSSFSIVGKPDRIDEHPDGLWIIDYKTSSQAPNGSTMLENGYRLQLPFYALASQKKFSKSALGFQFVQLDRKGTRTNGAYFKTYNGKDAGKLTDTTARSKSLLTLPRDEVWGRFEEQIEELGARYVDGNFEARPRISPRGKECDSCGVSDFCGYRRILEDSDEQDGGSE